MICGMRAAEREASHRLRRQVPTAEAKLPPSMIAALLRRLLRRRRRFIITRMIEPSGSKSISKIVCAMDCPFAIHDATALIDWIAIEIELHDVIKSNEFRAARPRHEEPVGSLRMSEADVPQSVRNAFMRQNSVGNHKVFKMSVQLGHSAFTP